jgi:hypothetical protein
MLTAAEIRLVSAILLTLLAGWAVSAWRERHHVEPIPVETPIKLKTPIRHFEHLQE